MTNLLAYDFVVRGLVAGLIIAAVAPIVGMFLVLRRYSLIADTLSHVSLAGIALGLLLGINPLFTAIIATVASSAVIDKLRLSRKIYGESALALFLSGSLAIAVILIGISHGFNATLFNYLFGSIATVTNGDIATVVVLSLTVVAVIGGLFKELLFTTFDEEAAAVSGVPTKFINMVFIILAAVMISLAIPIVGILLISALLVVPVITALQLKLKFVPTILVAQAISVFSVTTGIIGSFYLNLAPGGMIVLVTLAVFLMVEIFKR